MPQTWLITGADGFIGGVVCRLLADQHHSVVGTLRPGSVLRQDTGPWPDNCFHTIELRDGVAVSRLIDEIHPQIVINLAAVGVLPGGFNSVEALVDVNVRLPGLLRKCMPEESLLVQVGSFSQYQEGIHPLGERDPLDNRTMYAWSKNAAEGLLRTIALGAAGATICARLFGVMGPGEAETRLLPTVVSGCLRGKSVPLSDGNQVRDVLHVSDVALALVHVSQRSELYGREVNIGRGEGHSVRWMAERAAQRLGKTHLLKFGAVPRRAGEVDRAVADVTRLRQSGFKPRYSIEDSIDLTVDALVALLDPGEGV